MDHADELFGKSPHEVVSSAKPARVLVHEPNGDTRTIIRVPLRETFDLPD